MAAAPVEFGEATRAAEEEKEVTLGAGMAMARMVKEAPMGAPPPAPALRDALAQAAPAAAKGEALGELFQYLITTPVTVGRGQSAMVPIVSSDLGYRKDLLYNGAKMPAHPVATLRLKNESGLTLERGPVTVIEGDEYVGEAILPFTVTGGELVVPYSVELAVKVRESNGSRRETRRLYVKGAYLHFEEWDVRWREYQFNNTTGAAVEVLAEHPRSSDYELHETAEPAEKTDEHLRFAVEVPARSEVNLRVQERRLRRRREELQRQSYNNLRRYLEGGLIEASVHEQVVALLKLWESMAEAERQLEVIEKEREKVYKAQQQIQGNMGALGTAGKEGAMRARYVEQLAKTEDQLRNLAQSEKSLQAEVERIKKEIETKIAALGA